MQTKSQLGTSSILAEILLELGLTQLESTIFQSLTRSGSKQAGVISKQTGINRSHTYEVISKLTQRGLVSELERNGVRHFSSISLEELIGRLEEKRARLALQQIKLSQVLREVGRPTCDLLSDPKSKSIH